MKTTLDRVAQGVELIAEFMQDFPPSRAAHGLVAQHIHDFVGTDQQLQWFVQACIRHFHCWPGVPQLRALYCSKFAPDDGESPVCKLWDTADKQAFAFEKLAHREADLRNLALLPEVKGKQ